MVKPTFSKYTEVDEIYKKVIKLTIPNEDRWDKLPKFQEQKVLKNNHLQPTHGDNTSAIIKAIRVYK